MKTKRIVALALAGALALGAVATPVLADAPKALDLSAKKTTEAYAKIVKAQKEVVSDAQKKYDDAVASEAKKKAELEQARYELSRAKIALTNAELNLEKLDNDIEETSQTQLKYRQKKVEAEKKYADEFDDLDDNNAFRTIEDYENKIMEVKAFEKKQGLDNSLSNRWEQAKKYWFDNLKYLEEKDEELVKAIDDMKNQRLLLVSDVDLAKVKKDEAASAEQAAEEAWTQAWKDMETKKDVLAVETNNLKRIKELQGHFTLKLIQEETNPALVKLAKEDYITYFLIKLRADDLYISKETLDKLGLDAALLKQYHDILGDEETIQPAESDSQSTEAPKDTEAPKPDDTQAPKPEDKPNVKPEDKPNVKPADKPNVKPADKKGDKNVAPKTGDIAVLAYAGSAVLAAGAFVASKKRK